MQVRPGLHEPEQVCLDAALVLDRRSTQIAGALLALPIAAVVRQTVVYLRRHLVLEPWGTVGSGVIANVGVDRCPDCGASSSPRDSDCRSCGASLEERVQMPGVVDQALGTRALA